MQEIAVHQSLKGSLHVSLYSKCLVVNQTGLDLEYSVRREELLDVGVVIVSIFFSLLDKRLLGLKKNYEAQQKPGILALSWNGC